MDPKQALLVLNELEKLGFTDEVFWRLHHFRDRRPETINGFRKYCEALVEKRASFKENHNNERVYARLSFVLNSYREWELPPGRTLVFIALAEAAFLGIRPVQ